MCWWFTKGRTLPHEPHRIRICRKIMAKGFFKKLLPDVEKIESNRMLRWLGPRLRHPRLWHINRRGVALGLAIGLFWGLLIPVAQIPFSAALAIVLRANLPVAIVSTLVTNPFTFAPIYYLAYRLGLTIVGEPGPVNAEEMLEQTATTVSDWMQFWMDRMQALGRPLMIGLVMFASLGAVLAYFAVDVVWRAHVRRRWARRARRRKA